MTDSNYHGLSFRSLLFATITCVMCVNASAITLPTDRDNDGITNSQDNCSGVANPNQIDADEDGFGNLCDADVNNDGIVNFQDLSEYPPNFLSSNPVLDLNSDGVVNFLDVSLFADLFLQRPGPSGVAASNLSINDVQVFAGVPVGTLIHLKQAPGDSTHWYGLQRQGGVIAFDNDDNATATTSVLNISSSVDTTFEGGALGFAFDPNFETNGYLYISYTADGGLTGASLISRVSRFETTTNAAGVAIGDAASEVMLISENQPFSNHNGGDLSFGADGFLYWSLGDGGGGGDTLRNGQDTTNILSTVVRIDVNVTAAEIASGTKYKIPADNPFAANDDCTEACPEIFAWGLRNPFRFSFDRDTGMLWAGDVGQSAREEISIISNGGNYGWRCFEGNLVFNTQNCDLTQPFVDPQHDYPHSQGSSVTGGVVYRGGAYPALDGTYFFGDFNSGRIWGLYEGDFMGQLLSTGSSIVAFTEDADGEVYYVDFAFSGNARIFRLEAN